MKQTAVEFLEQELDKNFEIKGNSFLFDKILKQAKEMEKEQIEAIYKIGYLDGESKVRNFNENIYNQTFKSE